MLYKRRAQHANLCVIRVSKEVLKVPGVVITDCNASSSYARFAAAPEGLSILNCKYTYADNWTDSNQIMYYKKAPQNVLKC